MSQIEKCLLEVRAAVYACENNNAWAPKDGGASRVFIFQNPTTSTSRIVSQGISDKKYYINTSIRPDLAQEKSRENFVQWREKNNVVVGLSFSDAVEASKFNDLINKIKEGGIPSPTRVPPAPQDGGGSGIRVAALPPRNNAVPNARPSPGRNLLQSMRPQSQPNVLAPRDSQSNITQRIRSGTLPTNERSPQMPERPAPVLPHRLSVSTDQAPMMKGSDPNMRRGIVSMDFSKTQLSHTFNKLSETEDPKKSMSSYGSSTLRSNTLSSPAQLPSSAAIPVALASVGRSNSLYGSGIRDPVGGSNSNNLVTKNINELSPRDKRVKEIHTTEATYVQQLNYVIEGYLRPAEEKNVFSPAERNTLFANISYIRDFNKLLLDELETRLSNWNPPGSPPTCIGDLFLSRCSTASGGESQFLRIYSTYCSNHKAANALLDKISKQKKYATWLKTCQMRVDNKSLGELLITPVQRCPRYPLLLRELISKTDPGHPDLELLNSANDLIMGVVTQINQGVLRSDSTVAVSNLSKQIPGITKLLTKGRQLIMHGRVTITTNREYNYILLFSDIAVFAAPMPNSKKKLQMSNERIPLELAWVDDLRDSSGGGDSLAWQLNTPENDYLMISDRKEDKINWFNKFREIIKDCCKKAGCYIDESETGRKFDHTFKDGGTFQGEWIDAKMHGSGKRTYANKNVYEGHWQKGRFEGNGKMKYATGEEYDGEWVKDKPHGYGILKSNTATYTGYWDTGKKHGRGDLVWATGARYDGEWVEDKMHGQGTLSMCNVPTFEGGWKEGKFHGFGKLQTCTGSYEGDFEDDEKSGQGTMVYSTGDYYIGDWKKGVRYGKGTFVRADQNYKYEGDWVEDNMEGSGRLEMAGFVYDGQLKAGRRYGEGTLTTVEGTYVGGWADNKREGKGVWTQIDGTKYEGEWHNDLCFGNGTLHTPDGAEYKGKWMKGFKEGPGVQSYADGSRYSGKWQRGKRNGEGIFTTKDEKSKFTGDWVNDKREGNGELIEKDTVYNGGWSNDMRHGVGTYKNGDYMFKGNWKNDRRDGPGTLSHKGGEPTHQIYRDGVLIEPFMNECPPVLPMPKFVTKH